MRDGWVVLTRRGSAKRGDTWSPVGDVDLEARFEVVDRRGTEVLQRKADVPRQATVYRQRHVARAVLADLEAAGAQAVLVPVHAQAEKMVGQEVENLAVAADALWEAKSA